MKSDGVVQAKIARSAIRTSFGLAPTMCDCGCGELAVLLQIDPASGPDSPALLFPLHEIPAFVEKLEMVAGMARQKLS